MTDNNPVTEEIKSHGYRALFKNKNFIYLWFAQIFSQLGERVIFVVFVALIVHNFGTSTSLESWLYVAFAIPAILFTSIAGVFIDRWNKKYTMIATNILRALSIALLPLVHKNLMGTYAIAFISSGITQFFMPAEASSIPMLVTKPQLLVANSLFTTTMMACIIFGFVLGDPLIHIFSLNSVHWAITALFTISAIWLLFINYGKEDIKENNKKNLLDFFDELKQGFKYIKETPVVLKAMLKLTALFSIIVMLSILAISISNQLLYPDNPTLGAQKFVYIIAFSGIGMLGGAFITGHFCRNMNKYKMICTGFSLIGINLILLALVKEIPNDFHINITYKLLHINELILTYRVIYSHIITTLVGIGMAFVAIPIQTILQSTIPEDIRGKVYGVQFNLLSAASTVPVVVVAFGADLLGVTTILMIIGIPIAIFGISRLLLVKDDNNK